MNLHEAMKVFPLPPSPHYEVVFEIWLGSSSTFDVFQNVRALTLHD